MNAMLYFLKGCNKCGGDLIFDEGDWRCWQCGQYYSTKVDSSIDRSQFEPLEESARSGSHDSASNHHGDPVNGLEGPEKRRRPGYGARIARNIDSVIRAKKVSDERWWARNRQIVDYLDQGQSIRQIAGLTGRGERQIRVIRERLVDLRSAVEEEAPKKSDGGSLPIA